MHTPSRSASAALPDGRLRYRLDASTGRRVAVLPASCRHGHDLASGGYRASAQSGQLHVTCAACVAAGRGESDWVLEASAEAAAAAELDDAPYTDLTREANSRPPDAAGGRGGATRVGG